MKKQSGFTLIELLLVLAIIGIISAIAIPAMLGQRDRARDKSSQQNCAGIIADFIGQFDKAKDAGTDVSTAAAFQTAIVGTSVGNSKIPTLWQSKNPWGTTSATMKAYNTTIITETSAKGTATAAAATASKQGQVQIGFMAPTSTTPGLIVTAVYIKNKFKDAAGGSTNKLVKISNIE